MKLYELISVPELKLIHITQIEGQYGFQKIWFKKIKKCILYFFHIIIQARKYADIGVFATYTISLLKMSSMVCSIAIIAFLVCHLAADDPS